jgi:hypothetical protein
MACTAKYDITANIPKIAMTTIISTMVKPFWALISRDLRKALMMPTCAAIFVPQSPPRGCSQRILKDITGVHTAKNRRPPLPAIN